MDQIGTTNFPVWFVGLQFAYPLGNNAAENEYAKNKLKLEQTRTRIRGLESNVSARSRWPSEGLSPTTSSWTWQSREGICEERLKAFNKKNEVGLATTKDLLEVERELVLAKNNQIKALTGYVDAITELWRATGELLDREGIKLGAAESDTLYLQKVAE